MSQSRPDWVWRDLASLCELPKKVDPRTAGRDVVRYVDVGALSGPAAVLPDVPEISASSAPSRCRQLLREGDTIFSTVRPYMEKIGFIGSSLHGEFASTAFCVLRPGRDLHPKFLHYFARSSQMLDQVLPLQRGVSYPAVLDKQVRAAVAPVPPADEQRFIVETLENLLSRLDAAHRYQEAAARRLRSLRERLVMDAITGVGRGEMQSLPPVPAGTNDDGLPALADGWMWARLDEVAEVVGGVTKDSKKQGDPELSEVPYLRVANVQRGVLRLDSVTSIRVPPAKVEQLRLQPGDVLLNEGGDRDKLARGWVWEGQIDLCIHQNHVFRARVTDERVDPYFLSWTANTIGGRWAERNGKQSVNLASISLSMIRRMPVIIPPAGEASAVMAWLSEQLERISVLEREVAAAVTRRIALRRALLTAAFSGRLTGRDSDLERVEELVDA